ncbi:LacI family DNA-binding transcriptional regulator [Aquibacillus salsiterrae]|uniref:LacI family transcriptional regulator n=1 Tax=Aquibacillus salsiterrae TaxID=2950439 RepID=A0A9X4AE05_9BACI|nr:LacI family DNA-binding transcriptional regulator [Aquibacillus salsiterrae]MDC3416197.1 LacI family transcriptional regulator [Aquibacillus salsiterrae]
MSITIKDIAELAGVSYSTVSKALNNSPLVKPNTKAKIIRIAKEQGYEPNFAARRLVQKQSHTIGLVWPTVERVALSTLVTKIKEEIEKHGYSMILSINSASTAIEMFKRFQIDAVIVFEETKQKMDASVFANLPIISYGTALNNEIPFVDVNYRQAMLLGVKYLVDLGHKRISFVGDFSPVDQRQIEKYEGFLEAFEKYNLPVTPHTIVNTGGLDWYDGYHATKRLVETDSTLPTAVIGSSYDISAGIIRALREKDLIIPKDISVIGYDNIPQMANLETPLTSIGPPIDVIAKEIVTTVFMLMDEKDSVPTIQTIHPELKERASCAIAKST